MHRGGLHRGGRAAARADAQPGVDPVRPAGQRPQHAQRVLPVAGLAEHLAAAVHHGVAAQHNVPRAGGGHVPGLGGGQGPGQQGGGGGGDAAFVNGAGAGR